MSPRSFVLVANPHAGRGKAKRLAVQVAQALRSAGALARDELTTSIQHATELAEQAAAAGEVAVAIGGDGVLRAVAAGASRHGGTVGIVPCGRGNDFARTVGISGVSGNSGVDRCVRVLLEAPARPVDCIAVSPGDSSVSIHEVSIHEVAIREVAAHEVAIREVALGNVYAGFDSLSNALANKMTINLGPLSYSYTAVRAALTMQPLVFRLVIDGVPHEYTGSGVAIGNSAYYGRGVPVAPHADVHDGLLDVVMFHQVNRHTRIATLLAMRLGRHLASSGVRHIRARHIQVQIEPPLEAYSDGDPVARTPFSATVLPGAIRLLHP